MRYDVALMNEAIKIGIRALEVLFFGGLAGSFILIVITTVEDLETVLDREEAESIVETDAQS
jgi:hypothetical protein